MGRSAIDIRSKSHRSLTCAPVVRLSLFAVTDVGRHVIAWFPSSGGSDRAPLVAVFSASLLLDSKHIKKQSIGRALAIYCYVTFWSLQPPARTGGSGCGARERL